MQADYRNMSLLGMPIEIFDQIIAEAFEGRVLKRGFRLRLVNKVFSARLLRAVFEKGLIDNHVDQLACSKSPCSHHLAFSARYIEYRATHEPQSGRPLLILLRNIAEELTLNAHLVKDLTAREISNILYSEVATYGKLAQIFDKNSSPPNETLSKQELLVAALITGSSSLVKQLKRKGYCHYHDRRLFGYPNVFRAHRVDFELLGMLPYPVSEIDDAISSGHYKAFRFFYDRHVSLNKAREGKDWTWNFDEGPYRQSLKLDRWLFTPSSDIYSFVVDIRQNTKRWKGPVPSWLLDSLLYKCAGEGWVEMASRFLDMGVDIKGSPTRPYTPLLRACKEGHIGVVELLLGRGADPAGSLEMAAKHYHQDIVEFLLSQGMEAHGSVLERPAAGGNLELVRILLSHGADPNAGAPHPLVSAIALEHTRMFRLLIEQGAILTEIVADECLRLAKKEGLESMEHLLDGYMVGQSLDRVLLQQNQEEP